MSNKRGGQPGNDNAVKPGPGRLVIQISTKTELRLALASKLKEELSHEPSEKELRRKVQDLAFQALNAYLSS